MKNVAKIAVKNLCSTSSLFKTVIYSTDPDTAGCWIFLQDEQNRCNNLCKIYLFKIMYAPEIFVTCSTDPDITKYSSCRKWEGERSTTNYVVM